MKFRSDSAKTWLEDESGKQIALIDPDIALNGCYNITI